MEIRAKNGNFISLIAEVSLHLKDLYIYASEEILQSTFKIENLVATLKSFEFGKGTKGIEFETKLKVSARGAPLYLHLHLMRAGVHPDPLISPFDPLNGIYKRFPLLRNMKRPPKKVNLLENTTPLASEKSNNNDFVLYWYPDVTINLVNYDDMIDIKTIPPFSRKFIYADRIRKQYYPIIYFNEFWELKNRRIPLLDDKNHEFPLKITFSTTSFMLFRIITHFDFVIKQQENVYGEHNEFESIKKMLLETHPWLIVITVFISLLHSLFDFLAFKNGNNFWK